MGLLAAARRVFSRKTSRRMMSSDTRTKPYFITTPIFYVNAGQSFISDERSSESYEVGIQFSIENRPFSVSHTRHPRSFSGHPESRKP